MIRQYRKIKSQYKDAVLFSRLGIFYGNVWKRDAGREGLPLILNLYLQFQGPWGFPNGCGEFPVFNWRAENLTFSKGFFKKPGAKKNLAR